MNKKGLEEAVTKTVEYYFKLSSYEEAINKVLEEMGEKRMIGIHDKTICEDCRHMKISNECLRERHCKKCSNYGEEILPAVATIITAPVRVKVDCPHCDEEIVTEYDDFIGITGTEQSCDWGGVVAQCPMCEKTIKIEDAEWD